MKGSVSRNKTRNESTSNTGRDWVLEGSCFTEKTRNLRTLLKLTQAEFAAALSVDTRTIHNWESGRVEPRFGKTGRSRGGYETTVRQLLITPCGDKKARELAKLWLTIGSSTTEAPKRGKVPVDLEHTRETAEAVASEAHIRVLQDLQPEHLISALLHSLNDASRLFSEASDGREPWEPMLRAVANVDTALERMQGQHISYPVEHYQIIEKKLWVLFKRKGLAWKLCQKFSQTESQYGPYFRFTRFVSRIGKKHQSFLPGFGNPNVLTGSCQLRWHLQEFAPNSVVSEKMYERCGLTTNGRDTLKELLKVLE